MSVYEARTNRLYDGLSARERAVLELEASHRDEEPNPLIRLAMPNHQVAEFNRYITLLRNVARVLAPYILVLEQEVRRAQTELLLLAVLVLWGADRSRSSAALAPSPPELLTDDAPTQPDRLRHPVASQLHAELSRLSSVIAAVQTVVAEVQEEFDGHDVLSPPIREVLESARASLATSRTDARSLVGELDEPGPAASVLKQLREIAWDRG